MCLCDGARDFRPCNVQIEDNCEKNLCKKWSDTCARLLGVSTTTLALVFLFYIQIICFIPIVFPYNWVSIKTHSIVTILLQFWFLLLPIFLIQEKIMLINLTDGSYQNRLFHVTYQTALSLVNQTIFAELTCGESSCNILLKFFVQSLALSCFGIICVESAKYFTRPNRFGSTSSNLNGFLGFQ